MDWNNPAIRLQEDENCGECDCGCVLTHDDEGNPQFFFCPLHAHAAELLAAVKDILPDLSHYVQTHGPGPDRRLAVLEGVIKAIG